MSGVGNLLDEKDSMIHDLKCCGNCEYFEDNEKCKRQQTDDYEIYPSDCCVEWKYDGYKYCQRICPPYVNSDGN